MACHSNVIYNKNKNAEVAVTQIFYYSTHVSAHIGHYQVICEEYTNSYKLTMLL
jgi:hypothetical protein